MSASIWFLCYQGLCTSVYRAILLRNDYTPGIRPSSFALSRTAQPQKGTIPSDADIEEYFHEVENALKARGVRAIGRERSHALDIIKLFNKLEGPVLYPRVKGTEFTLQADKGWYILRGNVDVLVEAIDRPVTPSEVEIWDYKGQKLPDNPRVLADFDYQMNVYAELYRIWTGFAPKKWCTLLAS